MDPTNNPYTVIEVEERAFDIHSTLAVMIRFGFVGLLAGAVAGMYLESNARNARSTAVVLFIPGVVFGLGIMGSAFRFVSGRRTLGCVLFPFTSMIGFATIGSMFDVAAGTWAPQAPRLTLWVVLSAYSLPGVLFLMMGCALIAKPRSWFRFAFSGGTIALISGAAPLVTNAAPGIYRAGPRFFIAMFVAQVIMFLLFGWILGDTIADDDEWTPATEQAA